MTAQRWVLFDLDGTLLDYDAAQAAAVAATLREAGIEVSDHAVRLYREVNERHWLALERGETTAARLRVERWEEVLDALGARDVDVAAVSERYVGNLAAGSQVIDGAEGVVERIRRDHRVAFITNGLVDVQRPRLEASPLAGMAEQVVISDEVGAAKPDPAIFDAAFALMGDPPRDAVVMVGDSLTSDIAGGAAYGLETVWVAPADLPDPAGPRPTHRIADLRELPPLLRG